MCPSLTFDFSFKNWYFNYVLLLCERVGNPTLLFYEVKVESLKIK